MQPNPNVLMQAVVAIGVTCIVAAETWLFRVRTKLSGSADVNVQLFEIDVKKYSCGLITFVNAQTLF